MRSTFLVCISAMLTICRTMPLKDECLIANCDPAIHTESTDIKERCRQLCVENRKKSTTREVDISTTTPELDSKTIVDLDTKISVELDIKTSSEPDTKITVGLDTKTSTEPETTITKDLEETTTTEYPPLEPAPPHGEGDDVCIYLCSIQLGGMACDCSKPGLPG